MKVGNEACLSLVLGASLGNDRVGKDHRLRSHAEFQLKMARNSADKLKAIHKGTWASLRSVTPHTAADVALTRGCLEGCTLSYSQPTRFVLHPLIGQV